MAKPPVISNETRDVTAQCRVIHYSWKVKESAFSTINKEQKLSDAKLSEASRLDISSQIISVNYQKNMANPAGNFSITLSNSPGVGSGDWKDLIKRGDWIVVYMSQDGDLAMKETVSAPVGNLSADSHKIRFMGFVDRVAVLSQMTENGAFDVNYTIQGRDIGIVYEDTTIWHNVFQYDSLVLETIALNEVNVTGSVDVMSALDKIHDLMYYPLKIHGVKVNDKKSLSSTSLQWLLPKEMVSDIGFNLGDVDGGATYWGALPGIKEFKKTASTIPLANPADFLSGSAYQNLRTISVPELHEFFVECRDNGQPRLVFRPIPFALDKSKYPNVGKNIDFYKDLPFVTVPALDVLTFDLGEDNHERYNSFLVNVSTSLINTQDNISWLQGTQFPFNVQESIKRFGFRPMHVTVDSLVKNEELTNGIPDRQLGVEYNYVMYDYWNVAVYGESGNITKVGSNDIRVGKALKFTKNTPYVNSKRYYIEGYSDTFEVNDQGTATWTQDVMVTRGFEEQDLLEKAGFGERKERFTHEGEFTPANGLKKGKK